MTTVGTLAPAKDIRTYLRNQLNSALRRPGSYGGEVAIRLLLDHLLFVERRQGVWAEEKRTLERRGAWTPTGVQGAFHGLLPGEHGHDMASVYAEFSRRQGWLQTDRVLDAAEYASLRSSVGRWAAGDRVWSEVLAEFGAPSVLFGGGNPYYGKTLGYVGTAPGEPMVFFHLWNGADPGVEPSWPPARDEPVLLAIRCGDGPFASTFTFTPQGRQRREVSS